MSSRSSRQEVFCKKAVLKNFSKFTRKHLYQGLFFNKVAGLRPATLLKTLAQVFSCEFWKISKNTFFYKTPPVGASGVASFMIWRKPKLDVKISIFDPSISVLSLVYPKFSFALKSPRTTINKIRIFVSHMIKV